MGEGAFSASAVDGRWVEDGADGKGVSSVVTWYYKSSSATQLQGGFWSTTKPSYSTSFYLWIKTITTYTDNSASETTPIIDPDWHKVMAITDKFGTTIDGGLISTVTMLLREFNSTTETAGISGIQGANMDNPAFWAGGTYAEALADLAKIILRHNGTGKVGVFEVDEAGSVKIYDPEILDLLRLEFVKSKVPTVANLLSQTQKGQSVTNAARMFLSSGSAVLPNSINVTEEGAQNCLLLATMELDVTFDELSGLPPGMASASVALYKDGYNFANLGTLNSGELSESNYSYINYVLINKKLTVPKGVYTIVVSAYFDDAIGSAGINNTSTLSWILRKDIRRFIFWE